MSAEKLAPIDRVTTQTQFWELYPDLVNRGWIRWRDQLGLVAGRVYGKALDKHLKVIPVKSLDQVEYLILDTSRLNVMFTSKSQLSNSRVEKLKQIGYSFIGSDEYPRRNKKGNAYFVRAKETDLPPTV